MQQAPVQQEKSARFVFVFRVGLVVALVVLATITVVSSVQFGPLGVFVYAMKNAASLQLFVDLVIAILLFSVWMWFDAKKHKRQFWPWFLVSLLIGSFGPLLYLLFRKKNQF